MSASIKLYGVKVSMFTGKARSYLIKQGVDFEEVAPVTEHFNNHIIPKLGRRIIPVIEMDDGKIVQDTADIIDYLEAHLPVKRSAYPSDGLHKIAALILELFGDCGLIRPAMHYRWSFPEQTDGFITHGFGGHQGPDADEASRARIAKSIKKFSGFLPALGVTPETQAEVERAYIELLERLEVHFSRTPYCLGAAPTLGDYAMMCSLFAHLGRDPVPSALMKNLAPNLYRWTERMNVYHDDMSDMPYYQPQEGLPQSLDGVWEYIAKYFLPELEMNIDVLNALPPVESGQEASVIPGRAVIGFGGFVHGDVTVQCAVRAITFHRLQRVTDAYAALSAADQKRSLAYFSKYGLGALLTQTPKYRIMRKDYKEVWA